METKNTLWIAELIRRKIYQGETLDDGEQGALGAWLAASEANREFYRGLEAGLPADDFDAVTGRFDMPALWRRIEASTAGRGVCKTRRPRRSIAWIAGGAAAAAVALWLLVGVPRGEDIIYSARPVGVELLLADGAKVAVDSGSDRIAVGAGSRELVNDTADATLYFESEPEPEDAPAEWNSLVIPRGGQYSIVLTDGTRVWLNSSTTLRFPDRFGAAEREVELEGEAFFDVATDAARPFRVRVGAAGVTALGTRFNVTAYPADRLLTAALVEGSVEVESGGEKVRLTPDTQCTLDRVDGAMEVSAADTHRLTAWRDGKFYFTGYTVADIVARMELWYDFDMVYADAAIRDMRFSGTINKSRPLNELLRFIEQTGTLRFTVEGRTVTAYRK